ncbi:MAG: PIG-L family deacetylase [Candidatus Limnocylindrales bacterium]
MTHVFVAPHPDDVALSCGGLVASLRELGQSVTILTVYSGGPSDGDADYQREALGFGTKTLHPSTQAFNRSNIAAEYPVSAVAGSGAPWEADPVRVELTQEHANTQARQFWQRAAWSRSANVTNDAHDDRPLRDDVPTHGTLERYDLTEADPTTLRKVEDERWAYFIEAALVDLDLPDAVHRGYEGDDELLGQPFVDDEPPVDILRREILRLEPQQVYFPLGIGGHVDHRLCRDAGLALLRDEAAWVMPADDFRGKLAFYEDFPYAWWDGFSGLSDLDGQDLELPQGLALEARYADISDQLERKNAGLKMYAGVMRLLFDSEQGMLDAVAGYAARIADAGGVGTGAAERYWSVVRS